MNDHIHFIVRYQFLLYVHAALLSSDNEWYMDELLIPITLYYFHGKFCSDRCESDFIVQIM